MEIIQEKNNLRNKFSKVAVSYDLNANLQRKICSKLFDNIASICPAPKFILDIGAGTGFLMQMLSKHYTEAAVLGIDFAFGMNKFSKDKNLNVIQAEAKELPFKNNSFDLVASNLVYQWVSNLDLAFYEVSRVSRKKAIFYFSFFGKETLRELRFAFEKTNRFNGVFKNSFNPIDLERLRFVLEKNNFKDIDISSKIIKENFEDLFSLVRRLKSIGANRLTKPIFIGKESWRRANEIYLSNFKDRGLVYATFEVIEVAAKK